MRDIFGHKGETMGGFCCDPLTVMAVAGIGMEFIGGMQQAAGIKAAGRAQQQNAEYMAKQMEVQAGQARASGQRGMIEEQRRRDLALSSARNVSAAGGGSGFDILNILTGLKSAGDYEANTKMFEAEDVARGYESKAAGTRYEGDAAYAAAKHASKTQKIATFGKLALSSASLGMSQFAPKPTGPMTDAQWSDFLARN